MRNYNVVLILAVVLLTGCGHDRVGPAGPKGDPGIDANPVTVVQLCPNQPKPSYRQFPEQALCINGKLYGIYNTQNNGLDYLSELPPGNYSSVAPIGCNLVIESNCVVHQE